MTRAKPRKTAEFIVRVNINGLRGRMLRLPSKRNNRREILLIYPDHSSIEKYIGLAEAFNDFGGVTMPDIPGFGGMDSFYKVGITPSLESFADYLATFIKLRYRNRRFAVVGISFGFVVVTRMLQKYPEIAKKVDFAVSIFGFTHHDELNITSSKLHAHRLACRFIANRLPAAFFRNVFLHPGIIRTFYNRKYPDSHELSDFEVYLWRHNDPRTHMKAAYARLTVNNLEKRVDLPLHHVYMKNSDELDNTVVEQHLQVVFAETYVYPSKLKNQRLMAVPDKRAARAYIPAGLKAVLRQNA